MVGERGKPWQRKPATAWPQLHRLIARLNILNCIGLLVLEILEEMGPDCPGTIKKNMSGCVSLHSDMPVAQRTLCETRMGAGTPKNGLHGAAPFHFWPVLE